MLFEKHTIYLPTNDSAMFIEILAALRLTLYLTKVVLHFVLNIIDSFNVWRLPGWQTTVIKPHRHYTSSAFNFREASDFLGNFTANSLSVNPYLSLSFFFFLLSENFHRNTYISPPTFLRFLFIPFDSFLFRRRMSLFGHWLNKHTCLYLSEHLSVPVCTPTWAVWWMLLINAVPGFQTLVVTICEYVWVSMLFYKSKLQATNEQNRVTEGSSSGSSS